MMKETMSICVDKELLGSIGKIYEKYEFICEKCGAKMYDVNDLLNSFFNKEKSLEGAPNEQEDIALESQYLIETLCDRLPMSELPEKEYIEYETSKSYPEEYLRINNSVYDDGSECFYLKKAKNAYIYADDQCDCVKSFSA